MPTLSSRHVKETARRLGFTACGLAHPGPLPAWREAEWRRFLSEGRHADMHYLEQHLEKRLNPCLLLDGARTMVCVALNYAHSLSADRDDSAAKNSDESDENSDFIGGKENFLSEKEPLSEGSEKERWRMARYAYGDDYHEVMKQKLRLLLHELGFEEGTEARAFVDTAPVDEKFWAMRAGLGSIGRNTQLILPGAGSYFFLGELLLTAEADAYDDATADSANADTDSAATNAPLALCGSCRACVDACPTHALSGEGTMDARRCLSYLTIEHRGALPPGTGVAMKDCFYGCDRCAEACPWNLRFARETDCRELMPRPALTAMLREDWLELSREDYTRLFRKSAVKRAKFEGIRRNIEALAGNDAAAANKDDAAGKVAKNI
ncbi:MAG: tRNA epoxyqueuosine(34) reductase QueG [Alloprevotella sp.]